MSQITVRHNPDRERFEILDAGNVIGKAAYKDTTAAPRPSGFSTTP